MPTSTDVTKLNINELTEAQYDTAVQQGIIGANEISILTDAETGQVIQVATLPAASADELGNIYQFVGTTDANYTNGYFYKCVSDGQDPATYSWTSVEVQASSGGLPSQTGNDGKFLTTDGTDVSWGDALVNKAATSVNNTTLFVSNTTTGNTYSNSTIIGMGAYTTGLQSVAVGAGASGSRYGVAVGRDSGTSADYAISIGRGTRANANYAIQIGEGQNSDANTFKVGNANGNFEIMSANGTIPSDRLIHAINKYSTMPTAASTNEGWIVQFTGTTDSIYTHGHLYECVSDGQDPATYSWTAVEVQASSGSSYTAGTGIDITSGVISVTSPTLQNTATGSSALTILGAPSQRIGAINIGVATSCTSNYGVAIGTYANITTGSGGGIALGFQTKLQNGGQIAIGGSAEATASNAIQLGSTGTVTTNSDANTFKVANGNGNFEIMSADGTIPAARHASLPASDGTYVLKLVISGGVPTLSWVAE